MLSIVQEKHCFKTHDGRQQKDQNFPQTGTELIFSENFSLFNLPTRRSIFPGSSDVLPDDLRHKGHDKGQAQGHGQAHPQFECRNVGSMYFTRAEIARH